MVKTGLREKGLHTVVREILFPGWSAIAAARSPVL